MTQSFETIIGESKIRYGWVPNRSQAIPPAPKLSTDTHVARGHR